MRWLLPKPSVPLPWRRRLIELASGNLTHAICSRDFDVSLYFQVINPTQTEGFDHLRLQWADSASRTVGGARTNEPVPR